MFIQKKYKKYPIIYQSFAMEAQADVTRCYIILILLVQLSLEERGVIRADMGVSPLSILALLLTEVPKNVC